MSKQQIQGNLARLLATENLTVEHRKIPTAYFDLEKVSLHFLSGRR